MQFVRVILSSYVLFFDNQAACKIVTALIHFLFMSAFAWMMVEGLALYLSCTRPISAYGDMRMIYVLIGWGLPAIIVLITLGSNFQDYGEGEYSR